MNKPLILVSSVTYAMKGRDLLMHHGIRAYVERIPQTRETGCGYGIHVPMGTDAAEHILRVSGIQVRGRSERGRVRGL